MRLAGVVILLACFDGGLDTDLTDPRGGGGGSTMEI